MRIKNQKGGFNNFKSALIYFFSQLAIILFCSFCVVANKNKKVSTAVKTFLFVDPKGFEPLTLCLQSRCSNRAELGALVNFWFYIILIMTGGQ